MKVDLSKKELDYLLNVLHKKGPKHSDMKVNIERKLHEAIIRSYTKGFGLWGKF